MVIYLSIEVKCPKDNNTMILVLESEKLSDGTVKAYFNYRCPICGFKLEVERIEITRSGEAISIKKTFTPPPSQQH
mgnify:FL=1